MAISNEPWSKFSAADYSDAQWIEACLINMNKPSEHVKGLCKLPVKEPDGNVNRNGVHAAAARLAGAGGGVMAPAAVKKAAAKKLLGYYRQMGETPPESIVRMAQ